MSLVNALCSELTLTVKKPEATLRVAFQNGKLLTSDRTNAPNAQLGISISGKILSSLQSTEVVADELERWLLAVLETSPALSLYFNDRALRVPQ